MKYRLIDEEKAHHPVSRLASALNVTRAAYYAARSRPASRRSLQDAQLKALIAEIYTDSHELYGAPKIRMELKLAHGVLVGQKRIARLMRELDIVGVSKRRSTRRRRNPAAEIAAAPDLVRRRFAAAAPNELWVADITYIETWEGFLFLACVMDLCTKRIVGWSMRDDLKAEIVIDALGMATTRQRPGPGLVHHSDRGGQYRSLALGRTLRDSQIMQSMGSRGDAYDNAAAESFMSTIKSELVRRNTFKTRDAARLAIFSYIEGFYNPHRRHSALGYLSPIEYEILFAENAQAAAAV
jgi:putative transposase